MVNNKTFLATTALEDFWDISCPIVFLGEWCKRYNRKELWGSISSRTLPSYFKEEDGRKTYEYLNNVYERLLSVLHEQMNQIHNTSFSNRYWRIVLGTWLISYVHVVYDRYKNLENFIGVYPDFSSICLDKKCFIVPKDTMHFVSHLKNDDFNLQIYSSILYEMGYRLPTKELNVTVPDVNMYFTGKSKGVKNIIKYAYASTCKIFQNNRKVFLKDAYFSNASLLKLVFKTRGVVWPCVYGYRDLPDSSINHEARETFGKLDFGENKFEKILVSLLPLYMPQSMIESFNFLREKVKNELISEPRAIMSAISWWFDNIFRIWAAESAEKGTILLGVQHGGNYGIAANLLEEDVELGVVDKFYSWGWESCGTRAKVIPMPAPKLIEIKNKSVNKNDGVLYVLCSYPRYLFQVPWAANYWDNCFNNQNLFISNLSETVAGHLRIRLHREEMGWALEDRIRDLFPQIKIENWDISFYESIKNCSVYISDHPLYSTTFIEALANNKPSIIFYNPLFAANAVKDEAMGLFNLLKSNSIIFHDPVAAALHLNSVYGSIEDWWNEPKRQKAVKSFLDKYGRTSQKWLEEWSEEILSVAGSQK